MKNVLAKCPIINQSWGSASKLDSIPWIVLGISRENCYKKCAELVPAKWLCIVIFNRLKIKTEYKTIAERVSLKSGQIHLSKTFNLYNLLIIALLFVSTSTKAGSYTCKFSFQIWKDLLACYNWIGAMSLSGPSNRWHHYWNSSCWILQV